MPAAPERGIDEHLAMVRELSEDSVREDLVRCYPDCLPSELVSFQHRPGVALDRYAAALDHYWREAIAPYWAAIRGALNEEVILKARTLALRGPSALLEQLPGRVRWQRPWLEFAGHVASPVLCCDGRLVVVPSLFARGLPVCASDDSGAVAVSYQARGAALLSTAVPTRTRATVEPERGDRMVILVGRARSAVMRALNVPTTTSSLASTLGLSAGTVSEHLTALVAAGVVQRRRIGVRVLYELQPAGMALLRYVDEQ
jgi:DNA-binding transcriptional ArsR family regulator